MREEIDRMPIQLQSNGFFPSGIPWAQVTPDHSPLADEYALSYVGGNQAVMQIQIYPEDIYQAIEDLLGSNIYNAQTGQLDRAPPMRHPVLEWLYVTRITSIKGWVPDSKGEWPNSISGYVTTVPQFLTLTVLFQQPKYRILSDSQLDMLFPPMSGYRWEWMRFVEGWPKPRTRLMNQESGVCTYQETGSGIGADGSQCGPGPTLPQKFNSPWMAGALKNQELTLLWKRVPRVGLYSNAGSGRPTNLDAAIGTVNSSPLFFPNANNDLFMYPAGTLLFEGYEPRPLESPLPPELNPGFQEGDPNLLFDVLLNWGFADPPYDTTANGGAPHRGQNLVPRRGITAGDIYANGLWYLAAGSTGRKPALLMPYIDHTTIFQMVS
jgi:hypothetical protein